MDVTAVSSTPTLAASTPVSLGVEMERKQLELMKSQGEAEAQMMANAGIGQNINTTA